MKETSFSLYFFPRLCFFMFISIFTHMKLPTRALLRSSLLFGKVTPSSMFHSSISPALSQSHAFSSSSFTIATELGVAEKAQRQWILQFDGGARGNPGVGGCGVVLLKVEDDGHRKEVWHGFFFLGADITCNYAEYQGLIYGLRTALELKVPSLLIQGDSELIIRQMTGRYKCRHPKLLRLYETAKGLEGLIPLVEYMHIPRRLNSRADELSNNAMSLRLDESHFTVDRSDLMKEIAALQQLQIDQSPSVTSPSEGSKGEGDKERDVETARTTTTNSDIAMTEPTATDEMKAQEKIKRPRKSLTSKSISRKKRAKPSPATASVIAASSSSLESNALC